MKNFKFKRCFLPVWALILVLSPSCIQGPSSQKGPDQIGSEFNYRLQLAKERLTGDRYKPVFTNDFILADVNINLEDPRRFYNYSGDLSGRYIEALAPVCSHDGNCGHLDSLVSEALKYQKGDGRFGDDGLIFDEEHIGKEHTALLWGNGRLAVGLLEYHLATKNQAALDAAMKTAEFFLGVYSQLTPKVSKRLEGFGAAGVICFTQWAEPLAMLASITGDNKYADAAAKIYPSLPPRGIQHSHGYLTTLRGILKLFEYDKNQEHFDYVLNAYNDLIASDDFTIYGSVKEYFGGKGGRDEGCSTVDFIRLSLHLYSLTNDPAFLERAEFAVFNALYFNQFFTGDFGSHHIDNVASGSHTMSACWWCCTMSGLRALQIIRDGYFATNQDGRIKINLFIDAGYADDQMAIEASKGQKTDGKHCFDITITRANNVRSPFLIRKPSWISDATFFLNGKEVPAALKEGWYQIDEKVKSGDIVQARLQYQTRLILPDKSTILLSDISKPVTGALCYGPYIMAIDNKLDYTFLSEPNNNLVYSHTVAPADGIAALAGIITSSFSGDAYLTANYKHGGIPSYYQTVFRPISEMTYHRHPYMLVSMRFVPESGMSAKHQEKTMVDPWME